MKLRIALLNNEISGNEQVGSRKKAFELQTGGDLFKLPVIMTEVFPSPS
jgi:hypothetical protein